MGPVCVNPAEQVENNGRVMIDRFSSSRHPARQEPRLLPDSGTSAAENTASSRTSQPDTEDVRARLFPAAPVPRTRGVNVRGTSTPLIRKEIYADPTLGPVLTASFLAHVLLLAALLYQATHHKPQGSPDAAQQAAGVEMVFSQPQASSGMVGAQSPDAGGGNEAKHAAQTSDEPPTPADAEPTPTPPAEEAPSAPILPPSDDGLPKPVENKTETKPSHPVTGHKPKAPQPARPTPHAKPTPRPSHHKPSPLDHPMDMSFNEAPAPRRKQRGRPGGSSAPIDLSIGPMVENGELNAHYASRTTVHGVSSDYAAEIDEWIQRHLYYPPEAAERGDEGPSSVHVILDRTGHVFKVFLTSGSGSSDLDSATIGMFHGAQLPPVPPDMKDKFINFDVTVNYMLIRN
ncbi:TonB family protein [Acetobacter pasteurianus]|nr:TonB family protein [Acetobacter pasteurianus]GAB30186.1 TonB periplasmic protein [Acetobacter pasteurianus subsp. pasteurianus LMG 1262 = NBRC 106471]